MIRGPADDRGAVTVMLVVFVTALLVSLGLVVAGGAKLRAVQQANRASAEAARTAAQQLDITAVQSGRTSALVVDQSLAAARAALLESGAEGSVTVQGRTVSVTATVRRPTSVLGLVGIREVRGTGTATAELTIR
jgi:Flp pilus assembly protein TadG